MKRHSFDLHCLSTTQNLRLCPFSLSQSNRINLVSQDNSATRSFLLCGITGACAKDWNERDNELTSQRLATRVPALALTTEVYRR